MRLDLIAAIAVLAPFPGAAPTQPPRPAGSMTSIRDVHFPRLPETGGRWETFRWRIDLDLLAPLGDNGLNACDRFVAFQPGGPRVAELEAALAAGGGELPMEHPLLREAEAWTEARELRHRHAWSSRPGRAGTPAPTRLVASLAAAWIARGGAAADRDAALEDFRRVLRLGRLLVASETSVIDLLHGSHLLRLGAEAMLDEAKRRDDGPLALSAALTLVEADRFAAHVQRRAHALRLHAHWRGCGRDSRLELDREDLDAMLEVTRRAEHPAILVNAAEALFLVLRLGAPGQTEVARGGLTNLAHSRSRLVRRLAEDALLAHPTPADVGALAQEHGRACGPGPSGTPAPD